VTFLQIVNMSLRESGITQDDLTSVNFSSPPDPILTRFKSWCQQAYEDMQTDRRDWEFMQATGVTLCYPMMEVYGAYSLGGLVADFASAEMALHHLSTRRPGSTSMRGVVRSSPPFRGTGFCA